jgi:L-fuculose-phosphate aldolase
VQKHYSERIWIMSDTKINQSLLNAAKTLHQRGLLFLGAHANLSARAGDSIMITQRGSVADLELADIGEIPLEPDAGSLKSMTPAYREIVDMHTRVYQTRADIGALIHCHPRHATAFALAGQNIPPAYEPMLRFGLSKGVPVVDWAPRGSKQSVDGILNAMSDPMVPAVLLANHGVLVGGQTIDEAVQRVVNLEEAAELIARARALGGEKKLPDAAFVDVSERMQRFKAA